MSSSFQIPIETNGKRIQPLELSVLGLVESIFKGKSVENKVAEDQVLASHLSSVTFYDGQPLLFLKPYFSFRF